MKLPCPAMTLKNLQYFYKRPLYNSIMQGLFISTRQRNKRISKVNVQLHYQVSNINIYQVKLPITPS